MLDNSKKSIYQHTHLDLQAVERIKPLFESSFGKELGQDLDNPMRKKIKDERVEFAAKQYTNRVRISQNLGLQPLNEDAKIFGNTLEGVDKLFESVTTPGNVIGMGDVTNPMSSSTLQGGLWNPGYKGGSGDIPSYVFGLQSQIAMFCIGFELMPTIAVDTPKVSINYVDDVYGGGALDDADNLPSFLDFKNKAFDINWLNSALLKRGTTKIVLANDDGSKAVELLFIVGSSVSAGFTAHVQGVGTYESVAGFTVKATTTVNDVIEAMGTTGKVHWIKNGATTYTDLTLDTAVTVGYTSALRDTITEASTNNMSRKGMTRKQHEKGPKFKLNVISMDKQVEMVGFEFEADTTNIQIRDFAAQGINVIARLYNGTQNQLIQSIDDVILTHVYNLGWTAALNAKKAQGIDHSLFIAAPSKTSLNYSDIKVLGFEMRDMNDTDISGQMGSITNSIQSAGYENQITHAERLVSRILNVSEFVAQQNRYATPDYLVTGGEIAATVKKHAKYQARPMATSLASKPELTYSGTIFETISVYKNMKSNFKDPRILLGVRGDDTNPGAKFLAYDLAASRQTIAQQTMAEKIRVWSRFQIVDIGFYPELNYFTFVAINENGWS